MKADSPKIKADSPKNVVQSVAKAFAVLRAFDNGVPELTLSEVASRATLDRGTTFRLLKTVVELGYVRPVPGSKRFRLGLKCLELGFSALAGRDLPEHAAPLLREAVPKIADAGSLGVLEQGEVIYLERVQAGLGRHGIDRRPGSRTGAYASALGHAILAYLPRQAQVEHLESIERVKVSERTVVDLEALLDRLAEVRQQGYAVSDGENAYGLRTGAVANDVGIDCGAFSGGVKVSAQAARSMGGSVGFSASVGQPSTFLMVIWPDASSAQNSMAAVSAEGRTV